MKRFSKYAPATVTLEAQAYTREGGDAIAYHWRKDGVELPPLHPRVAGATAIATVMPTELVINNAGPADSGIYTVRATVAGALWNESEPIKIEIISETSTAAPTQVAAAAVSPSQINVSWSSTAANVGFVLERRVSTTSTWTRLTPGPGTATSYSDTGLAAGTTYFYQVGVPSGSDVLFAPPVTATTQSAGVQTRTLTVQALDVDTNQPLAVQVYTWTGANIGIETATTSFTRQFAANVDAKIACLPTFATKSFRYMRSGEEIRYETTWTLPMLSHRTVTVAYGSGPAVPRTLQSLAINGDSSLPESASRTYTATATFTDSPPVTVQPQAWTLSSGGLPATLSNGVLDAGAVTADTQVTVQATYSEGGVTRIGTKTVTIRNETTASAHALNLSVSGQGEVMRTPNQNLFNAGATVVLRAVPVTGYRFTGWGGDASGAQSEVTLTMNGTKNVSATFVHDPNYFPGIRVNIEPAGAVAAGALWRLDSGPWRSSGATVVPDSNGDHNLFFSEIPGYSAPAVRPIKIVSGQPQELTASYVSLLSPGALQVVLQPEGAVTAGAQWRPAGGAYPWQNSGSTLTGLPAAVYSLEYNTVTGWSLPAAQNVAVTEGRTATAAANYGPGAGLPALYTVLPSNGPTTGGTVVTIDGANFVPPLSVFFDGVPATAVTLLSATQITAIAPPRSTGGTIAVKVVAGGGDATKISGFTYGPKLGERMQLELSLGGAVTAVDVFETRAYLGQGANVVVLDVTNPANPVQQGSFTLPYAINDLAVFRAADSKLYGIVAASEGGLAIVDVTTPGSMLLRAMLPTGGYARDVALLGGFAYLADGDGGFVIADLSDPVRPTIRGRVRTVGHAANVFLEATADALTAYIADASGNRFHFYDVSNPESPVRRGEFNHGYGWVKGIYGFAKKNNILYAGFYPATVLVLDVTDLAAPVLLRKLEGFAHWAAAEFVQGNTLYSVRDDVGVDTFDISNPAAPSRLTSFSTSVYGGFAQRAALRSNHLYIAGTESGLSIINVANPASPSLAGTYKTGVEHAQTVHIPPAQSTLFVGNLNRGVNIFGVETLGTARLLTRFETGDGGVGGLASANNLLFAAGGSNGMYVVDVASPSQPIIRGRFTPVTAFGSIGVSSGRPVVAGYKTDFSGQANLWTVDVSNPGSPTTFGTVTSVGGVRNVVVGGGHAFVAASEEGLHVFDLSDARNPRAVGSMDTPGYAVALALSADARTAYIAEGGPDSSHPGGVLIVDVSSLQSPVVVGTLIPGLFARNVSVSGQRLVVSRGSVGVSVFDLANPRAPVEVANFNTPGSAQHAVMEGDRVYVADGYQGVAVLTLLDFVPPSVAITNPTFAATYTATGATLTIGGSASDDKTLGRVAWANDRGGSGDVVGLESWTAAGITLQPGVNVIRVTAFDAAGNAGSDTLTVTYNPPDSALPIISIVTPTLGDMATVTVATAIVAGIATDNLAVASVEWANNRGGAGTAAGTASWSASVALQEGPNVITVTARDSAGNSGNDTVTIFYTPPDTTPPAAVITFPTVEATILTTQPTINLAGTARDDRAVKRVSWVNSRGGAAEATGTVAWAANLIPLHSGLNVLTITAEDEAGLLGIDTVLVTLAPSTAIQISRDPLSQGVPVGSPLVLSVAAAGGGALSYQWRRDGRLLEGVSASTYSIGAANLSDAGAYSVAVSDASGVVTSAVAHVSVFSGNFSASHSFVGVGHSPGRTLTVTSTLSHAGIAGSISWQVLLPPTWTLAASGSAGNATAPSVGTADLLEWQWSSLPASPLTFTYTLNVPPGFTGNTEITALAVLNSGATANRVLVKPDPLGVPRGLHTGDTSRDGRLDLAELTRVIELFNTRNGTTRTGAYRLEGSGEDGFATEPSRAFGVGVTLTRYHSADTKGANSGSPRDGAIDLDELLRVIQLYNHRAGTVRTGQYRVQPDSEDGFASGP